MVPYMVLARDRPYMVLGLYEGNLEDLVEESVGDAAAFEASFKALKSKRKEAEKLPSFERVDCLTVSLAPLKAALTLTLTLSLTLTLALTLTLTLALAPKLALALTLALTLIPDPGPIPNSHQVAAGSLGRGSA